MSEFKLYSYFRSSAAYRVRIALQLKKIAYEYIPVHLLNQGGEQYLDTYRNVNPMAEVPTLIHKGRALAQSMAIIQYLDAIHPSPGLFPSDAFERAKVIQLCEIINSGIHPIQNLKVLNRLAELHGYDADEKFRWAAYWVERGFFGLESQLSQTSGRYCFGDSITAADLFLVPQVYNARRFKVDLKAYPRIAKIEQNCLALDAFKEAAPEAQPDFTK